MVGPTELLEEGTLFIHQPDSSSKSVRDVQSFLTFGSLVSWTSSLGNETVSTCPYASVCHK